MYLSLFKTRQQTSALLVVALLVQCSLALNTNSWAKKKKEALQRDFLPPIASINPVIDPAELAQKDENLDLQTISLAPTTPRPQLLTTPRVKQLDTNLDIHESDSDRELLIQLQQKLSEADLKTLWDATVEKNPVIRFSLEKLALPPDIQEAHSSQFMKKSLNLLLSGAAIATTMLPGAAGVGGDYYRNVGTMAGRDALSNVINGPQAIPENLLSPTEKIQLAGLVDELQATVIQTYHNYRNTLQTLANAHKNTLKNNSTYAKALKTDSTPAQIASGAAYYKALLHETDLRQKAKQYRLQLERLAGIEPVSDLKLSVAFTEDLLAESAIASNNEGSTANEGAQ